MSLKEQISEDMKTAMRAKDSARLGTIRLLLAAIKQKEVDERIVLDDAQVTAVIDKMLKQRRDSISQYESARPPGSGGRREVRTRGADRLHAAADERRTKCAPSSPR